MEFIIVAIAVVIIFLYNKIIEPKVIIKQVNPFLKKMMEKDYEFLLRVRYKDADIDVNALFSRRIRDGILITIVLIFVFAITGYLSYMFLMFCFIAGFMVYKNGYTKLKSYYKARLHYMDSMLPYYLKSLEILIQHYTVPVAIGKSIADAPEIFREGLVDMINKINAGDSTVTPYMEFAQTFPVRDSMRMMRLLYRLSLGRQERKQEQLITFSKTISNLQQKARDQRYKARLEKMESKTMSMLVCTGVGIMILIVLFVMKMM